MADRLSREAARMRARIDRLVPTVRSEVRRALEQLRDRLSIERLIDVIERGDAFTLAAMTASLGRDLQPAVDTLKRAFQAGAEEAHDALPIRIRGSLRLPTPTFAAAAEQSAAQFVTGVTAETRDAIRAVIVRSFRDGIPPRQAAQLIRPLIGLTRRDANAVLTRHQALVARGLPLERVRALTTRYATQLRNKRALTIARTETIQASADGQIAIWKEAQRRGLLPNNARKRWLVTPDDRLCPVCAQMVGPRAIAPIDGFFDTPLGPKTGPTMHPNCRCALALVVPAATGRVAA
jgi:hypothetical protein